MGSATWGVNVAHCVLYHLVMSRIVVAVFLCCLLACALADCPPVQSAQNFNVTSYTGLWYTQMQMPVIYLPPKDNYCVTANYSLSSPTTVDVYNYANVGEVNGPAKGGPLCAIIPDPSIPSQLRVGLCHLPKATYRHWQWMPHGRWRGWQWPVDLRP